MHWDGKTLFNARIVPSSYWTQFDIFRVVLLCIRIRRDNEWPHDHSNWWCRHYYNLVRIYLKQSNHQLFQIVSYNCYPHRNEWITFSCSLEQRLQHKMHRLHSWSKLWKYKNKIYPHYLMWQVWRSQFKEWRHNNGTSLKTNGAGFMPLEVVDWPSILNEKLLPRANSFITLVHYVMSQRKKKIYLLYK